jgi:hypothetical protein
MIEKIESIGDIKIKKVDGPKMLCSLVLKAKRRERQVTPTEMGTGLIIKD